MSKPAPRLGKGLSALIGSSAVAGPRKPEPRLPADAPAEHAAMMIAIAAIRPNPRQPRTTIDDARLDDLVASVRANGVIQPILVRPLDDGAYELVAGQRRLRAAEIAGLGLIPAVVKALDDRQSLQHALIENLQRDDLSPLARAAAYRQYLDSFGGTVEELAHVLSESRANVANYLRLLSLHPDVCFMLGKGELSMGQARALAGVGDTEAQLALARLAVRRNLSVRQVEALVAQRGAARAESDGSERVRPTGESRHLRDLEDEFRREAGLRVRIRPGRKKNSGALTIYFDSLDEFDQISDRLKSGPVRR